MDNKLLVTYSLLVHLREKHSSDIGSLIELFVPLVKHTLYKMAILDMQKERIMGENLSELTAKIKEFFEIEIPDGVLRTIMSYIHQEINNIKIFDFHKDGSFAVNPINFGDIDTDIISEQYKIDFLRSDFLQFCQRENVLASFDELIIFITNQGIELFDKQNMDILNVNLLIPKYINARINDVYIFSIMQGIYLGGIITNYLSYKIDKWVVSTELLIDTNYFISLINLNTQEAYNICKDLFDIGVRLGFKFSILETTVNQIKTLLDNRINDFSNKEIGLIKEADIFGACVRRKLDRSDLEQIRDKVDKLIAEDYKIDIITEARISSIISKAKKSQEYEYYKTIRYTKQSALNDAIALYYVKERRGTAISSFKDVTCWFLHNSYYPDYEQNNDTFLYERIKISANELLTVLWLTNPGQDIDKMILTKGGLCSSVLKYRNVHMPSESTIKLVTTRVKKCKENGGVNDRDMYNLCTRMAEGHFKNGDLDSLLSKPDNEFINAVKSLKEDNDTPNHAGVNIVLQKQFEEQQKILKDQQVLLEKINDKLDASEKRSKTLSDKVLRMDYDIKKQAYVAGEVPKYVSSMNNSAWGYLLFSGILIFFWFVNRVYGHTISEPWATIIALFSFVGGAFAIRFINHNNILKCLKFAFCKGKRRTMLGEKNKELTQKYESENPFEDSTTRQILI